MYGLGQPTLMGDLEDRPQHLMLLLALVAGILGIFQLVLELEKSIFDVVEAIGWWLAVLSCVSDGRHDGSSSTVAVEIEDISVHSQVAERQR